MNKTKRSNKRKRKADDDNINKRHKNHEVPIYEAAAKGDRGQIDSLIKLGADINSTDRFGNTVAHLFIFNQRQQSFNINVKKKTLVESDDFAKWLISQGFNFDLQNKNQESALDWAIEYNLQHILPTLFSHTTDAHIIKKCQDQKVLLLYLKTCHRHSFAKQLTDKTISILLYKGISIAFEKVDGKTAIDLIFETMNEIKIFENSVDILELFHRVIDCDMWCRSKKVNEYKKLLRFFIEKGCDVNKEGKLGLRPIQFAARVRNFHAVEILMEHGVDLSVKTENGQNLLHLLAYEYKHDKAHDDSIQLLFKIFIEKGCDVNSEDKFGFRPIQIAFKEKNFHVVKILMEYLVDWNIVTKDGQNLLHLLFGDCEHDNGYRKWQGLLFDLLIDKCCDVNHKDDIGRAPLHMAVATGTTEFYWRLIKYGADVNCRVEKQGNIRPLDFAIGRDFYSIAERLLDNGAKLNYRDTSTGETLLHKLIAAKQSEYDVKLLLKYGIHVNALNNEGESALALALKGGLNNVVRQLLEKGADINDASVIRFWQQFSNSRDCDMDECVRYYICKRKHAGFFCSAVYNKVMGKSLYNNSKYLKEDVQNMKTTFIEPRMSLYDWMHLNLHYRYIRLNNINVAKDIFHPPYLEKQLPAYMDLILLYYKEAVERKSIIERAKEAWGKMTEIYLPDICSEMIFSYLTNEDLNFMMD